MSWLRVGDTFATDPRVLELGSPKDERLLNEAVGFVVRCAAQSAGHKQDAFVSDATAVLVGGPRTKVLVKVVHRAGIFAERGERAGKPGWQLLNEPELLHIRLQAGVDWEAQHRALLRDPDIFLPVRLRDGDACRYCARIVIWKDGKSGRGGTLDHILPDGDDLVVACKSCNSKKQDRSFADAGLTLLPPPVDPYYGQHTLSVFTHHGITDPRPGSQPDPAFFDRDPAASRTPPSDPARPDPATRPAASSSPKHVPPTDQPDRAQPDQRPSGRAGNGAGPRSGRALSGEPALGSSQRSRRRTPSGRGARGQPPQPSPDERPT
jgi:5-methylcytosine-specific restriction endonuclease McrA